MAEPRKLTPRKHPAASPSCSRLRLVHPSLQIGVQGTRNVLVDEVEIEPLRIEMSARPPLHLLVVFVAGIEHSLNEFLVSARASHVLWRPRPCTFYASRHLRRRLDRNMLL